MDNYYEYVQKYATKHGISVREAENHALVREVKKQYEENSKNVVIKTEINAGCGSAK